jgi:hypothetical protein
VAKRGFGGGSLGVGMRISWGPGGWCRDDEDGVGLVGLGCLFIILIMRFTQMGIVPPLLIPINSGLEA